MTKDQIICTSIGAGILVLFIILYCILKSKENKNKSKALEFLDNILDEIKEIVLTSISNIDISDLKNLKIEEIIASILKDIYDGIWEFVQNKINERDDKDIVDKTALKFLNNKNFIDKYIDTIVEKFDVESHIETKISDIQDEEGQKVLDKSEKEDKDLQEEFSDSKKYFTNEVSENDLTVGEDLEEIPQIELDKLNPQTDEEEKIDLENDSSVEVIDDDIFYDKAGRARSKKTGRYTKVPK